KNSIWRIIVQNLVIKSFPEELYVLSHHVHHAKSDRPGDPYNAGAGLMYCFLADVNHQLTAKNLTREKYYRARRLLSHTGVLTNTYGQYKK
ncbi:MAG: acyl-CoA desaturase, partial [Ginsengibacter sp.]